MPVRDGALTHTVREPVGVVAVGNFKRAALELGGKSANVIFDDADVEAAISDISSMPGRCVRQDRACRRRRRSMTKSSRNCPGVRSQSQGRSCGSCHDTRSGNLAPADEEHSR